MKRKAEKADIYDLIEMCAIHQIALGHLGAHGIPQLDHIAPGRVNARHVIDEHLWGTMGLEARLPHKTVKLIDCETEHLKNILRTQPQITSLTTLVIIAILMERGEMLRVNKNSSKLEGVVVSKG